MEVRLLFRPRPLYGNQSEVKIARLEQEHHEKLNEINLSLRTQVDENKILKATLHTEVEAKAELEVGHLFKLRPLLSLIIANEEQVEAQTWSI